MMRPTQSVDRTIIIVVGLLLLVGTVMVYSASALLADTRYNGDAFFFKRQLLWLGISAVACYLASRFDYQRYAKLAWPLIITSLILLIVVLFGREINGAKRWISLGLVGFQPSEIFKYSLIIFLATMLPIKREKITQLKSVLLPAGPIIGLGFGLILLEPNLGTVLVLSGVVFVLFFMAGVRARLLTLFIGGMGSIASFMVFVIGYKRARVDTFLASVSDPLLASYQVKQSILAIGSGGFLGRGLGHGSAKLFYLPAPHTDFIFATLAEEGGFLLALFVLVLVALLVWRGVRTAIYSSDLMGFYLALGITLLIFVQTATNLLVATAMIPATGLPLPFMSYGGSSMVFTSVAIGILLNISKYCVATPQLFRSRVE
jgi:cell division protein FtsW